MAMVDAADDISYFWQGKVNTFMADCLVSKHHGVDRKNC
jgi:hypothetical protein